MIGIIKFILFSYLFSNQLDHSAYLLPYCMHSIVIDCARHISNSCVIIRLFYCFHMKIYFGGCRGDTLKLKIA